MVKINDSNGVLFSLNKLIEKINLGDIDFETQLRFIKNNWLDENGRAFLEIFKIAQQTDKTTLLEVVCHYKEKLTQVAAYLS